MTTQIDPSAVLWWRLSRIDREETSWFCCTATDRTNGSCFSDWRLVSHPNLSSRHCEAPITEGSEFAWVSQETSLTSLTDTAIAAVGNDVALQVLRIAPARLDYVVNLSATPSRARRRAMTCCNALSRQRSGDAVAMTPRSSSLGNYLEPGGADQSARILDIGPR